MTLGLKDLYYAKVTMQDGVENYGEPKKLAEALNADLSVKLKQKIDDIFNFAKENNIAL